MLGEGAVSGVEHNIEMVAAMKVVVAMRVASARH